MSPKIVVAGSSNTDMICRVPHIPKPGETVLGGDFFVVQGGKGANQAVAAARAGGNVTFIACVGDDLFGRQALESYKSDRIDTSCIEITSGVPTGVALINVADSGENSIAVAPGANARLTPEIIDHYRNIIAGADMVLVQLEIPIETVCRIIRIAWSAGVPVVLNPAPAATIDREILSMLTLVTPNEHEALLLAGTGMDGCSVSTLADRIQDIGAGSVVITTGSEGAFFRQGSLEGHVAGIPVTAVDSTAAGDTFNGYLVVELARGKSLAEAIQVANKAAALSVTRMGAQPSIPWLNELTEL
ncbi:MAG: ribokinase [Bacteroidota bacterium]